ANLFGRYLRSLLLHGICIRLHQAVVLLGRGDERRVAAHAILPIEYRNLNEDVVTVFENASHGDGTTRTFIENATQLVQLWREGGLAECPNATEDQAVERFMSSPHRHADWKRRNLRNPEELRSLGSELGISPDARHALSAIARVLTG